MGSLVVERMIAASRESVFDAFADFHNGHKRIEAITRMEVLTDGPIRTGTRFRETRVMFKKEHTEEMEIIEFTPHHSYTVRCDSCGARYETQIRFEPVQEGTTRVSMHMNWRAMTFFAKLMSPLGHLMLGSLKKCLAKDIDDMARVLEGKRSASTY